uniref:AP-3 complex subunit mu-1 n=1 Tax=Aceria tosichella TaxID=561515 RepID=A0A6G1SPG6_9ACAR
MLIDSLFIMSPLGDIIMEKHWQKIVPKSDLEYLTSSLLKAADVTNVPPVIQTPFRSIISVYRNDLLLVAIVPQDSTIDPLFAIEFLHRIVDIVQNYFGDCNENLIKEQLVTVYELLDEMLDAGYPFATELNVLKELIKPPNFLRTIANSVTGRTNIGEQMPTQQVSNVPWRKLGIKYTNNEAYFDVIEELDVILDKNGAIVTAEINGVIDCNVKLSGMPDLNLTFVNSRIFDDVSFHPCVRHRRWESERNLSFVPPDGVFRLMTYHIRNQSLVTLPLFIKQYISFKNVQHGKLDLQVGPKRMSGKVLENVTLEMKMPKNVNNMALNQTQGKYTYDTATRVFIWEVGKLESKNASIKGSLALNPNIPAPDVVPTILVKFVINQASLSDVRVNRLDMFGEKYKPFKGVKYISRAGVFQMRT